MRMQHVVLSIVTLALCASVAAAGGDTEFTYQGRLVDAGAPAEGTYNVDFSLWDSSAAGNQVGSTITINSLPILEGLFTVDLDFGASAFDNNDRWLQITVDGVPLVPRQPITRTPYAIQTRGIFVNSAGEIGIGTADPDSRLHVVDFGNEAAIYGQSFAADGIGVSGLATDTNGTTYGGRFQSQSSSGTGVYGLAARGTGTTYGGNFQSNSTSGSGVFGLATATTGTTYGGFFRSDSTSGRGVFGLATADTGVTYGGRFETESTFGTGVHGNAFAGTGTTYGGRFQSTSTAGHGVLGTALANTGTTYGGRFKSNSTSGFAGYFEGKGNDAVYIVNTDTGRGLRAVAPSDTAVWAQTTTGFAGVHGQNASTSGLAVYGQATASSGTNYGVYGKSNSASGYDFYAGGAGVNYGASSSRRWKNNVEPISDPLHKLSQLRGVYFDWDDKHGGAHDVGMIAEEVGAVLPEIVQFEENGIDASGMDYSKMTPLLVEAVNALRAEKDAEIAAQAMRLTSLERENAALQDRLDSLAQQVEGLMSTR